MEITNTLLEAIPLVFDTIKSHHQIYIQQKLLNITSTTFVNIDFVKSVVNNIGILMINSVELFVLNKILSKNLSSL